MTGPMSCTCPVVAWPTPVYDPLCPLHWYGHLAQGYHSEWVPGLSLVSQGLPQIIGVTSAWGEPEKP
jgi:hypothetical protein